MERWELIICWTDHSWTTDYVEVVTAHIDSEGDILDGYIEDYNEDKKEGDPDIAYVGVYNVENIEDEEE